MTETSRSYVDIANEARANDKAAHEARIRTMDILDKEGKLMDVVRAASSGHELRDQLKQLGESYAAEVATSDGQGKHARRCREQASKVVADIALGK